MHVQQENNNTVANGNIKAFPGGTLKKVTRIIIGSDDYAVLFILQEKLSYKY